MLACLNCGARFVSAWDVAHPCPGEPVVEIVTACADGYWVAWGNASYPGIGPLEEALVEWTTRGLVCLEGRAMPTIVEAIAIDLIANSI